jgi:polyisoprenyl-phosphate glycosyltransferase
VPLTPESSASVADAGRRTAPRVSIATAMYNEELVAGEFLRQIGAALDALDGGPHEIVVVDDGSGDRTLSLLQQAAATDPRLVIVALSRNFGHQAALSAALDHVTGDVVIAMDADLQDSPSAIATFLDHYARGYDVVYAQRVRRKEPWYLRLSYFVFYRLTLRLSNVRLPVDAGDFGLMSRRVVDQLRRAPERHRYLRGLRTWVGFQQTGAVVERGPRYAGDSKYSPLKLLRLAFDGIFAFSIVPLRAAAVTGLLAMLTVGLFSAYAVYVRVMQHRSPAGFTAIILIVTFLSGVNLFFLGVIGEYVGRVYEEVKARPLYIVSSVTRRDLVSVPDRLPLATRSV